VEGEVEEEIEDDWAEIIAEEERANAELMKYTTETNIDKDRLRQMSESGWGTIKAFDAAQGSSADIIPDNQVFDYRGAEPSPGAPIEELASIADNPIALFFYFVPVQLWVHIRDETNRYKSQNIDERVEELYAKQARRYEAKRLSANQIRDKISRIPLIQVVELICVVAMLIPRAVEPRKEKLHKHRSTSKPGLFSQGTWGKCMGRDRFFEITHNLHFSNNSDMRARTDRAWKIRPVVNVLLKTFQKGFSVPSWLSFDEGILPSFSPFNKTRTYMKGKPHKWGTKLFITCCAQTSYCLRFEVYCGKKQDMINNNATDERSGLAAVVRNLKESLPENRHKKYVVVVDRFYTYVCGTCNSTFAHGSVYCWNNSNKKAWVL
jgi:hypothetical protein